jgi:hypothetical protein
MRLLIKPVIICFIAMMGSGYGINIFELKSDRYRD